MCTSSTRADEITGNDDTSLLQLPKQAVAKIPLSVPLPVPSGSLLSINASVRRVRVSGKKVCPVGGGVCHYVCECDGFGDPHINDNFFTNIEKTTNGVRRAFDFQELGVHTLAKNAAGDFELQAFTGAVMAGNKVGNGRFNGFALKYQNTLITVVKDEISNVDENTMTMTGDLLGAGITLKARDNAFDVWFASTKNRNEWRLEFDLTLVDPSDEGVCASMTGNDALTGGSILFSQTQLTALCTDGHMINCDSEPQAPENWATSVDKESACRLAGISISDASAACNSLIDSQVFFNDCVFDYCATNGDASVVSELERDKAHQEGSQDRVHVR